MVDVLLVRKIVGIIGNVISFGLFLSPVPTFQTIWKKKDVEEFSPMPYLATLMNCAIWITYGMPFVSENNTLVYTINGIGFVMEAIYLIVFFFFSKFNNRKKISLILALEAAFMVIMVGCVLGAVHALKTRTYIVGILAVIFGTCMYAAPLTVMKTVISTKSVEYMPLSISMVCFINGLCWSAYSLLKFDVFVLIPNGLGSILGFSQLVLYFCYYKSTPKKDEKPEVQMQPHRATIVAPDNV